MKPSIVVVPLVACVMPGALAARNHHAHLHPARSAPASELPDRSGRTFTVQQTRNANYKGKLGLQAMIDVYKKYGVELTPELKEAVRINKHFAASRKRQTVEAVPPQDFDYEFISPVQVGTPAQTLYLSFDSGASDLWVFSTDTNTSKVKGQGLYSPQSSSTSRLQEGYSFSIGYGDGSGVTGLVYSDRVELGGLVVDNMIIESATEVSAEFTNDPYCWGLLGLGMSGGSTVQPVPQPNFMDRIRASLARPLFTADLKSKAPGSYSFGFIGAGSYTGSIQYAPVDRTSIYWRFAVTGYRIGPQTTPGNPNSGYTTHPFIAIADTGTTLMLLPDDIVDAYWAAVPGAALDATWGAVLFPCDAALPDFTLGVGLYKGVVPGRYMSYGAVDAARCYGGLQSQGSIGFSILGDVALKAQFAVFDLGGMRLGLANKDLQN